MMSTIQQQFADEWKKVSAVVESEARRQLLTSGHLDYSMLNDVLRDERDTWFNPNSARHQWLEQLDESGEFEKVMVTIKLRQMRILDVYHVGGQRISTLGQKVLYLLLSILVGFLVWFGTDVVFSPTVQEYLSSPLKWVAFPLLATVLVYTLCLPAIAKSKNKKIEQLICAVNEEMGEKGAEIFVRTIKNSN
jgi:hypothetical protein